jgi:hypothetical protein
MLDAGNSSSYPGTGTVWYDISGNGHNFNITAGAYTNIYTGNSLVKYMNFGGTYNAAVSATGADVPVGNGNGVTVCCWTRIKDLYVGPDASDWRTLLRGTNITANHAVIAQNSGYELGMYDNDHGTGFNDSGFDVRNLPGYPLITGGLASQLQTNQEWVMMVFVWQSSAPQWQFFINNNPTPLGSISSTNATFNGFTWLGSYGNSSQWWGDISVFQQYNRVLSQAEINQNFETFAPRFNGGTNTTAGTTPRTINVFPGIVPAPDSNSNGVSLYNDGTSGYWSYPGDSSGTPGAGFQYRSLFTHGYLAGGYKGSSPWRAVNRTWHATDITMYCGEQLAYAAEYIEGTFSDYNGYVHGTPDAYATASSGTQSYSLANGTARTMGQNIGFSPPSSGWGFPVATGTGNEGGANLSWNAFQFGCAVDQINQVGYITGGGSSACDRFHMPSETMFSTTGNPVGGGFTNGCHGQLNGYFGIGGPRYYINYANQTWTSFSSSSGQSSSKYLSTKLGWHYGGDGSGVRYYKMSDATGTDLLSFSTIRSSWEENMQMGQNWGYMLGNYDGQQNNQAVKFNYLNDTILQMGVATQPKGHYGQSSGTCSSAAATIANSNASVGY